MYPQSQINEEIPFFFVEQEESQEFELPAFNNEETISIQENPFRLQRIIISNNHQSNENSN